MPLNSIFGGITRINQTVYSGGAQFDIAETLPRQQVGAPAALSANQLYVAKVRFKGPRAVSSLQFYVAAASGNVDLALFDSADAGVTLTRQGSTGSTVVAGVNAMQVIAMTAPVNVVNDKDYWLGIVLDNAVATVGRLGVQGGILFNDVRSAVKTAVGIPIPASVTGLGSFSTMVYVGAP